MTGEPITTTARVGPRGDTCDECKEAIAPYAHVVLYLRTGDHAKMLHERCVAAHAAKAAA